MSTSKYNHVSDTHGASISDLEGPTIDTGDIIQMGEHDNLQSAARALDQSMQERNQHDDEYFLIPGNHDMTGEHGHFAGYQQVKAGVAQEHGEDMSVYEALTGKEGEDPEDAESIYDVVISQYDNVIDARDQVIDRGDHAIYFGNTHEDPELPDPDARDLGFGYDFEDIAEELSEENPLDDFGFFDYANPLNWPTVVKSYFDDYEVDEGDLDYNDVPDELKTDEHKAYESKKQEKIEKLEGLNKPVILADHAVARDEDWKYSSDINRELAEEGYVDMILGGHDHSNEEKEVGDAKVINSANGYTEIDLDNGVYEDSTYNALEPSNNQVGAGEPQLEGEQEEMFSQIYENVMAPMYEEVEAGNMSESEAARNLVNGVSQMLQPDQPQGPQGHNQQRATA